MPQDWRSVFDAHLVFNADPGIIQHFGELDEVRTADDVLSVIRSQIDAASSTGVTVKGVQIDFDCPTRLLPNYARVMHRLRSGLGKKVPLSATGVSSWVGSKGLVALCRELSFFVPQYYEGRIPRTLSDKQPLGDFGPMSRQMEALGDLPCEIRIGVPNYGHCLLYDANGAFRGVYHGLTRKAACRHSLMRFASNARVENEDRTVFSAEKDGKRYSLVYRVTTLDRTKQFLDAIDAAHPKNVTGAVIYRLSNDEDTMSESLQAFVPHQPAKGTPSKPIESSLSVKANPFSAIESGSEMTYDVTLTFDKTQIDLPFRPDALTAELTVDGDIEEVSPGDFDRVERADMRSSLAHSRTLIGRISGFASNRIRLGPIRVHRGSISAKWTAHAGKLGDLTGECHTMVGTP